MKENTMSFSISARASTKDEAKQKIATELEKVIQQQPAHAQDQAHALAAAGAYVDLLADDGEKDVVVGLSGSIWHRTDSIKAEGAGVTVSAHLAVREPAQA